MTETGEIVRLLIKCQFHSWTTGWHLSKVSASVGEAQQPVGHSGRHIQDGSVANRHIIRTAVC